MGLFKRSTAEPASGPSTAADDVTSAIDFAAYDLDTLGQKIRSIVDIPGAFGQAAKYAFTLPLVVAISTWFVFSSRMAAWALVPFTFISLCLALVASMIVGGFLVARKRLDTIVEASGQVVGVIGDMHADISQIKDGQAETSVQKVAVGLLENAIFPAVFGTLTTTAETSLGPLGRFAGSVTKAPMNLVQKSVVSAIQALPDKEIGQLVDDAGAKVPAATTKITELGNQYSQVRGGLEGIVGRVSQMALRSMLGLAFSASIPLLIWLAIGWVLS